VKVAEAPHLFAAGAAVSVMACCLVAVRLYAGALEQRYVRALAPATTRLPAKSHTLTIQRKAFAQADLLPVYGSSELIIASTHDADRLFADFPTGFRPFAVASAAATPIILTLRLGSLGAALHGKRVVISITPREFYRPPNEQPSYNANFSRVQATALTFSREVPYALRRTAARRMVQYAATLADDPILRWGVEALADDSPMGTVRYAAVLPLGLLQGAILDLCEHWQFVAFVHRHPDLRGSKSAVPARIDWPSLESDAASDAANRSSNNPFGLDGNYWLTNAARLQHTNDGPSGRKPLLVISLMVKGLRREPRNLEWQDFTVLLDIVRALGGKPLVVSAPFPGPFYDYWGMTAAERARYYAQMRAITSREHVPLVDFSEHDGDRNFIRDAQEHLTDRGWVQYDEVFDAFFHGATVPGARPPTRFPASASLPN
jgi:D-alanine transfer protein